MWRVLVVTRSRPIIEIKTQTDCHILLSHLRDCFAMKFITLFILLGCEKSKKKNFEIEFEKGRKRELGVKKQ